MFAAFLTFVSVPAFAQSRDGYNRWVWIINDTSVILTHFYASNVSQRGWGRDILGREVLYPGERVEILIDDGTGYCMYDFRAIFDYDTPVEFFGFNACEQAAWTIHE
jgi:hypothetical protein